ncbi:MAG: nucleotidyltransferase family protein [Spirochaetales bacterium]|nr:nucleotidyltransferase family protein [Spirochaetales bacterium]
MTALITAAGYSRRAGTFKPLLPLGSRTVIEQTIAGFLSTCSSIVVVGGHNFELLRRYFEESPFIQGLEGKITLVYNENYPRGMFTSVQAGAAFLGEEPFFFTPADIPAVRKETVEILARQEGDVVLPSFNRKSGHPVRLSGKVKEAILQASPEETLRDVLNKYEKNYVSLQDEAVLRDLDSPEDYRRMVSCFDEAIKE